MANIGDVIEFDGIKAIVLTTFVDNYNYLFVNQVTGEDLINTQDFYLLIDNNGTYTKVTEQAELDRLFPKIQEGIQKSMNELGVTPNELGTV